MVWEIIEHSTHKLIASVRHVPFLLSFSGTEGPLLPTILKSFSRFAGVCVCPSPVLVLCVPIVERSAPLLRALVLLHLLKTVVDDIEVMRIVLSCALQLFVEPRRCFEIRWVLPYPTLGPTSLRVRLLDWLD